MTIGWFDLALYAGALLILFLTPGPVWLALMARSLSGGFNAAWPLAFGVAVGDILWPLLAILGVGWVAQEFDAVLAVLRWVACLIFLLLGWQVIRNASKEITQDSRLTRPGMWSGFAAGLVAILGNPKAVLFYMGVLPGFFDLGDVTRVDIVWILAFSVVVPLLGNLAFALFIDRARRLLRSPSALRRTNFVAGGALIFVGLIIPFT